MASSVIFIFFSLLALGFLKPSEVAATNIGTKSSPGRDEAITHPVIITLVTDVDHNLNQSNLEDHKSMSFDIYEDNYEDFIQKIRDELKNSDSHGIPVLTPQRPETAENAAWLDIRLVAEEHSITVRLEQSNLYVRGYARSSDDFFWQFSDTNLITGAQNLSFSGSYAEPDGVETTAGTSRDQLPLGGTQLANAVHEIAKLESPHGTNASKAAHGLLVIIQMISEAARFRTISQYISDHYWNYGDVMIDRRMAILENSWVRLSTAVLQTGPNPTDVTQLPNIQDPNPSGVSTFGQALAVLGILVIKKPRGGSTIMTVNAEYGRSLMNLEYVRVNNIDGEDPGNLFGTVRVDDGWFNYTFYDRSSGDYENVGPGGFATLKDSSQSYAVSGADTFVISVDLFDYDSLSPNDEIAKGKIVWDSMIESVTFENYDKHLQRVVKGEYGDVTVGYSVLSNALAVTIEVVLVYADGESPADVYGSLAASQVLEGSVPITLFNKASSEYVQVEEWQLIPLTRTVIAASTYTKLTITADLWDYDSLSPDDAIAQGSVDFTVQPGKQSQYINGRYGQVNVFITCE